jgi:hypothetical protein
MQVMGLQGLVQAYGLTSLSTKEEAAAIMNTLTAAASKPKGKGAAAADPAVQVPMLLYCTPEKIVASKRLMSKLEKLYQVWLFKKPFITAYAAAYTMAYKL